MRSLVFAILFALMDVLTIVFVMASLQTMEWCINENIPIPWQAYALLVASGVWCAIAIVVCQNHWAKIDRFFTKLTDED